MNQNLHLTILSRCFCFVEVAAVFQLGACKWGWKVQKRIVTGTFIKSQNNENQISTATFYIYLILFNFLNICCLLLNHSSKSSNEILKSRWAIGQSCERILFELSVSSLWFSGVCAHGCLCACVLCGGQYFQTDGIKREEEEIFNWATFALDFRIWHGKWKLLDIWTLWQRDSVFALSDA